MTRPLNEDHDLDPNNANDLVVVGRCSPKQERFWRLDRMNPGTPALNIAVKWHIRGHFDAVTAQEAFQAVFERHCALQTTIQTVDGELAQTIRENMSFKPSEIDLSTLPEADRLVEADHISDQEARKPFDLATGPLFRVTLIRLSRSEAFLLVTVHHMVGDGWSMGIIAENFVSAYQAFSRGSRPTWPDLPLQYCDYAEWCREEIANGGQIEAANYWKAKLADLPHVTVPPDRIPPPTRTSDGAAITHLLPLDLTSRLSQLARGEGVTFFVAANAVLIVLLQQRTGRSDVAVSTQLAGRDDLELESVVGPFVNTLVLRTPVANDMSFLDLCRAVRNTFEEALEYSAEAIDEMSTTADSSRVQRDPPVSVNFIVQRAFIGELSNDSFQLIGVPSAMPGALYDLNFILVERKEGWRLTCEYHRDLYEEATAKALMARYESILNAVVSAPQTDLSQLQFERQMPTPLASQPAGFTIEQTASKPPAPGMFQGWLRRTGTQPILFAINHTAQNVNLYRTLAKELGQDQPFATLKLTDTWPNEQGPSSIRELAAIYCETIVASSKQNTVRLAGFCRSGVITFEVARQLVAAGHKVDCMVLIDCWAPGYFFRQPYSARSLFRLRRALRFAKRAWRAGLPTFFGKIGFWLQSTSAVHRLKLLLNWGDVGLLEDQADFWRATDELEALVQHYTPVEYAGRVLLFRSDAIPAGWPPDVRLGWSEYLAADTPCVSIPGNGHEAAFSDQGSKLMAEAVKAERR